MKSRIFSMALALSLMPFTSFADCKAVGKDISSLKKNVSQVSEMTSEKLVKLQKQLLKSLSLKTTPGDSLSDDEVASLGRLKKYEFMYLHLQKKEVRKSYMKFLPSVEQELADARQELSATEMESRHSKSNIIDCLEESEQVEKSKNGAKSISMVSMINKDLEKDVNKISDIAIAYHEFETLLGEIDSQVFDEEISEKQRQNDIKDLQKDIDQMVKDYEKKNKKK